MFQNFEFHGFKPANELKIYGNVMLCQTADYVPGRFSSLAKMTKEKECYSCLLEIYAQSGVFIAEANSKDPKGAIDEVDHKMREQILSWRTKHFILSAPNFWRFKKLGGIEPKHAS